MPFGITPLHILIVAIVALVILGPKRLPKFGSAVGKSIKEFRHAVPATKDAFVSEVTPGSEAPPVSTSGAAAGAKVGSVAGRTIQGFRASLTETRDAFQAEVRDTPPAAQPAEPAPVVAVPVVPMPVAAPVESASVDAPVGPGI